MLLIADFTDNQEFFAPSEDFRQSRENKGCQPPSLEGQATPLHAYFVESANKRYYRLMYNCNLTAKSVFAKIPGFF